MLLFSFVLSVTYFWHYILWEFKVGYVLPIYRDGEKNFSVLASPLGIHLGKLIIWETNALKHI